MAWRIHEQVTRALIDNRVPGKVTGTVWLAGRDKPLELELRGNAWPDLAGCLLTLENPEAVAATLEGLFDEQHGVCGDMTASRKYKRPTVPLAEWLRTHPHEPFPYEWDNGVYLEWYSERNGRVVIELSARHCTISEPQWRLTPAQEAEQQKESAEAFAHFMSRLSAAVFNGKPPCQTSEDSSPASPAEQVLPDDQAAQRSRIEALKQRVREVTGEDMVCGSAEGVSLDDQERFWQQVLDFEQGTVVTVGELLARDGFCPPSPETLNDLELREELEALIQELADHQVYLQYTDHLSDRDLYSLLYHRVLSNDTHTVSAAGGWNTEIDMSVIGLTDDDDGSINYLRYYADARVRNQWALDFPNDPMPPHVDPPYDRDQWLPRAEF